MRFYPDGIEAMDASCHIERDRIITHEWLASNPTVHMVPEAEHCHPPSASPVFRSNYGAAPTSARPRAAERM